MNEEKVYLGNGVYAAFDGFSIVLTAGDGPTPATMLLEPWGLRALVKFAASKGVDVGVRS